MFQDWVTARNKTTNMKVSGQNSEGKKKSYLEKADCGTGKELETDPKRNGRWKRRTLLSHPIAPGIKIIE